LSKNFPKI
jgi:hypothetical protein